MLVPAIESVEDRLRYNDITHWFLKASCKASRSANCLSQSETGYDDVGDNERTVNCMIIGCCLINLKSVASKH